MKRRKEGDFRRELEAQGPTKMTRQTKQRLKIELERLQLEITEKTAALGATQESAQDWHDNAAYDHLQQQLDVLESRHFSLTIALRDPEIIEPRQETNTAQLGNSVVVHYQGEEHDETFTILGPRDSTTNPSWISEDSPLAKALIGHQPGSTVKLPEGKAIELVEVLPGNF